MAKKRKTKRKSSPSKSYGGKRKTVRRRKRSGFISERMSQASMIGAAKSTASGTLGGIIAGVIDNLTPNQPAGTKVGIMLGASFVSSWLLRAPNMGAGIAGAAGYQIANMTGMLSDDNPSPASWADPLKSLPLFLDENGNELDNDTMLSDNGMLSESYAPGYSTPMGGQMVY